MKNRRVVLFVCSLLCVSVIGLTGCNGGKEVSDKQATTSVEANNGITEVHVKQETDTENIEQHVDSVEKAEVVEENSSSNAIESANSSKQNVTNTENTSSKEQKSESAKRDTAEQKSNITESEENWEILIDEDDHMENYKDIPELPNAEPNWND